MSEYTDRAMKLLGHLLFGSFVKLRLHTYTVKIGDDDVVMTLPIDIFGTQSTLHTRGVSVDMQRIRPRTYCLETNTFWLLEIRLGVLLNLRFFRTICSYSRVRLEGQVIKTLRPTEVAGRIMKLFITISAACALHRRACWRAQDTTPKLASPPQRASTE